MLTDKCQGVSDRKEILIKTFVCHMAVVATALTMNFSSHSTISEWRLWFVLWEPVALTYVAACLTGKLEIAAAIKRLRWLNTITVLLIVVVWSVDFVIEGRT